MKNDDVRKQTPKVMDPGKGKRSPALWGQWLIKGLQRQMLDVFSSRRDTYQGLYEAGTPKGDQQRRALAKRRAKTKVGRRQRVHQQMAHRGK